MTKDELASRVQAATGLSLTAAVAVIDAIAAEVKSAVARGEAVTLARFGTFKPIAWPGRAVKHPSTGARAWLPTTMLPHFTPSLDFKEQVRERARGAAPFHEGPDAALV